MPRMRRRCRALLHGVELMLGVVGIFSHADPSLALGNLPNSVQMPPMQASLLLLQEMHLALLMFHQVLQ